MNDTNILNLISRLQQNNDSKAREALEQMNIDDLDYMAYGYIGGQIVELEPSQITIKWHEDMKNPQHKFSVHGMNWVRSVNLGEPVEISIAQDGTVHLEDGHHRYFAACRLGKKLKAVVEIKGKPIRRLVEMSSKGIPIYDLKNRPFLT